MSSVLMSSLFTMDFLCDICHIALNDSLTSDVITKHAQKGQRKVNLILYHNSHHFQQMALEKRT